MKVKELDSDRMVSNILKVYAFACDAQCYADCPCVAEGTAWYQSAHDEIRMLAEWHGKSHRTVAGMVAALSPQLRWSINIRAAEAVLNGQTPRGVLSKSIDKARRIMGGEAPESVLSGPKVTAFFHNLCGDLDGHITVDVHAASAAIWQTVDRYGIRENAYRVIARAYAEAARIVGVVPAVIQAIVWVTWRRHFYAKNQNWKLAKLEGV